MTINEIKLTLSTKIDQTITDLLVDEYFELRKRHFYGDIKGALIHCGLFSECSLVALNYLYDGKKINLNRLNFDKLYNKILNYPKNTPFEEQITIVIPRVLRTIYTIRSKKKAAHMKETLPDELDSEYILSACNWVLSQFLVICGELKSPQINQLINSIMAKKIPVIEEFEDGDIVILNDGLTFKDEMLLVLYKYPSRLTRKQLAKLLKPKNSSYISTYLRQLKKERLVHENSTGIMLTEKGINHIDQKPSKFFNT